MKCRFCQSMESKVIDTRPTDDGTAIRRRRECIVCGKRFTTYEKIEDLPVMVIKKDGSREPFDIMKVRAGVRKACEKRPVSAADIDHLVDGVEKDVNNLLEQEVDSATIGSIVMERLKKLDEVAYVRFASVYRQFTDINTFMNEIKQLLGEKQHDN
ncbi:MAG: transcriptional regulator NrdR [Eubacteriales bacterium]|nr:transcriptional regulator NrdR [Eubacteriales bacterium]MCI7571346.1 transcriptional regulator NrdR [Clostridiales bacterium]MDD7551209.1 transcriptional regulator NrdR [Clostridia bacterium]MDY5755101.1 transcriptional regulator NrdR [Eubacteriales bacterium]